MVGLTNIDAEDANIIFKRNSVINAWPVNCISTRNIEIFSYINIGKDLPDTNISYVSINMN